MNRIAVYCGSSSGTNPIYEQAAKALGKLMAERQIGLVYGGAQIGIMGAIANEVLTNGGEVIGVIPGFLDQIEITHRHLTELHVTEDMPERKNKMFECADGFIALPGGIGTLEELFEIFTWRQLRLHTKPIGILNTNGYYDLMLAQLKHSAEEGFLKKSHLELIMVESEPAKLIHRLTEKSLVRM